MQRFAFALAALLVSASCLAADLRVTDSWVRWIPGGAPSGGYFTVHNDSAAPIELLGARSPDYGMVSLHRTVTEGSMSRMVDVDKVTVPVHGEVRFAPGGYHLMMMRPGPKVKVGGEVTVELRFSGGRTLDARFPVRGPGG